MNLNSNSISRVEHLKPFLRFLGDIGEVLITDDAKDIMVFSTPAHPSPMHHNQFGVLLKMLTEMGIMFVDVGKKMLEREDRQNLELRQILAMLQQSSIEREEREYIERLMREKRVVLLKQYFEMAKTTTVQPLQQSPIYGGNLNDIRTNRPRPLPAHIERAAPPKPKLQL